MKQLKLEVIFGSQDKLSPPLKSSLATAMLLPEH